MNRISIRLTVLALAAGFATAAMSQDLAGSWTLQITNLEHREISSMTIRFSDERAPSCMAGNWKRVVVESAIATDRSFFPMSDPLSYSIEGSELTIGRNEVCDGYLQLHGKLDGERAQGSYSGFGISGGGQLGHFSLRRAP